MNHVNDEYDLDPGLDLAVSFLALTASMINRIIEPTKNTIKRQTNTYPGIETIESYI